MVSVAQLRATLSLHSPFVRSYGRSATLSAIPSGGKWMWVVEQPRKNRVCFDVGLLTTLTATAELVPGTLESAHPAPSVPCGRFTRPVITQIKWLFTKM